MTSVHRVFQRLLIATAIIPMSFLVGPTTRADAGTPKAVAFLGAELANDNAMFEPTTDTERGRLEKIEAAFKAKLDASGAYKVVVATPDMAKKIADGQTPGACNGCEIVYAKEMGGDSVAWITVQKVSNLILNMNLYMGDVASNKLTFVHSVDIRGNTDESWTRSLNYLMDNYLLAPASQ